jgi:hypothetical protein
MKNPLEATPVTTLSRVWTFCPTTGEARPAPWMSKISRTGTGGGGGGGSLSQVAEWAPRPLNVSVAKPSHSVAGSKTSAEADDGLAAQGVVGRGDEAASPLAARVEADLADHIEDRAPLAEDHGVIAIEPAGGTELVGDVADRRDGRALGQDEDVARGHGAGQVDRQAGRSAAIEIHLNAVTSEAEIDGRASTVVDLDRLVVRAPLDEFGDEQLRGLRRGCGGEGSEQEPQGEEPGLHETSLMTYSAGKTQEGRRTRKYKGSVE